MARGKRLRQQRERAAAALASKPNALTLWGKRACTALTIVSIPLALYLGRPRVIVGPADTLRAEDPLKIPFVAKNEGYLSAKDLRFSCVIVNARLGRGEISGVLFGRPDPIRTLDAGENVAVPCFLQSVAGGGTLHSAEIRITETYRIFQGLWLVEWSFWFDALQYANGQYRFSPRQPPAH